MASNIPASMNTVNDSDIIAGWCYRKLVNDYKEHDEKRNNYMKLLLDENSRLKKEMKNKEKIAAKIQSQEIATLKELVKFYEDERPDCDDTFKKKILNQKLYIHELLNIISDLKEEISELKSATK